MDGDRPGRPWRSLSELDGTFVPFDPNADVRREWFDLPTELVDGITPSRRSFLKLAGFGFAGAALSACSRAPIEKAIPLLVRPETIVPGKSYWMATTCAGCPAGCGVLAKCRDGRPIKLEGNPQQSIGRGGLCAVGQAQLLSLYDAKRLTGARHAGDALEFSAADTELRARLDEVRARGGAVRVLTGTETSPSTRAAIDRFVGSFRDGRHVAYDALSSSALLDAHAATHGVRALPRIRLERARRIVAIEADFLGTWISPVEYTLGRRMARDPERPAEFARHVQIESAMSLSGSVADRRLALAPWQVGAAVGELARHVAARAGVKLPIELPPFDDPMAAQLEAIAADLFDHHGRAVVLCGSGDVAVQKLVNWVNEQIGAYGTILDLAAPSFQRLGDERALATLRRELDEGKVEVLVIAGVNPAYDFPDASAFRESVGRVGLVVCCATHEDETTALAHWVLALPHFLETWNDAEPVAGLLALTQPTVPPLKAARTLRQTLASWLGDARDDHALVRDHHQEWLAAHEITGPTFEQSLHEGFFEVAQNAATTAAASRPFRAAALEVPAVGALPPEGALAPVLHAQVGMPDGRHAHNPWLHELPDPITKVVWDNVAAVAPATAQRLGVTTGDVVRITAVGGQAVVELPLLVQPGMHPGAVAIARFYGRRGTDRFTRVGPQWLEAKATVAPGGVVGVDVSMLREASAVELSATGRRVKLACTQDHHSLTVPEHLAPEGGEVRDAVREVTLATLLAHPQHALERETTEGAELWPEDHLHAGPQWGMAIDLSACTGCSACVVGCQAENNVPVVGRDEVRRHREMHWIRIDRYWQGEAEDPRALHQPMMCQQCGHAPCETVCPVLATVHSTEGLNQQIYNRCVGTRYCANNCPYKVRRFNWFDYPHEDRLQNLALNPDVAIRSRGVMEKCSFCVQRILEAKLTAKEEGRSVRDGDVQSACQQSCPAQAIVFGDLSDPASRVSRLAQNGRSYRVLEELNVKPVVNYLAVVRDQEERRDGT